jgi:hypothetical protein
VSTEITERTCTAYCQPGEIVCIGYAPVWGSQGTEELDLCYLRLTQVKQCTYNLTLNHVRATIVAVEKQ